VLLGLQRDSESLIDYFDSVVCLLLTLEACILHMPTGFNKILDLSNVSLRIAFKDQAGSKHKPIPHKENK
jgi:hypothetical protein